MNKKHSLIFYIKYFLFLIYSNTVFKFEHFLYSNRKNKKTKRRLFLSSGNISLINVLTIIKQFPEDNCEDILVIDTFSGSDKFFEINSKIASLHNFKKIIKLKGLHFRFNFMKYNLFDIDEVYAHTKPEYFKYIFPMYKNCKFFIFDEGISSLIEQSKDSDNSEFKLITTKICDKFDKIGWDNNQIEHINPEIFKSIASEIAKIYPFDVEIKEDSKTVIFCSQYWQAFSLSKEEYYNYQNSIIEKLLENGFTIIYKQHPREEGEVEIPKGCIKTNCLLPLELYDLDILAIVSVASSILLDQYHYWQVPGFECINEKIFDENKNSGYIDLIRYILKEYIPNVNELLNINAKNYSKAELKEMLKNIFKQSLDKQPLLSENKLLREYYDRIR